MANGRHSLTQDRNDDGDTRRLRVSFVDDWEGYDIASQEEEQPREREGGKTGTPRGQSGRDRPTQSQITIPRE